jgi:protein-disulfide isomerase
MLCVEKLKKFRFLKFLEVFKNPLDYIASLGLISFGISMILLCVSLFDIKKLCILCAFTYILNLLIGFVASEKGNFIKSIKQSFFDFVDAVKIKKYLIAFIAVMLCAGGFLTYTATSFKFAPQVKKQLEFKEFVKAKSNKYAVTGNVLGDENAKLIVYVYSDYQCPICYAHNIMMHKLAKEVKGIRIVHKNLPLDTDCNKYLQAPFHEGSCIEARYAIASEKQGKLWEMNDILFQNKPKTEDEILRLAEEKDFDIDKLQEDANSNDVKKQLSEEIDNAYSDGINGTPATIINDNIYVGIKPYKEYVEQVESAK